LAASEAGQLVAVSQDLLYPAQTLADIKKVVADRIATTGPFTVAEFRDLVGTTRKYAVPLLEYFDQTGVTRRQGDVRVLGPTAGI